MQLSTLIANHMFPGALQFSCALREREVLQSW
jgi:hypothetical protein